MNLERWRERDVERIRALNGQLHGGLTGKERFMYETVFACMDKLESLTERIKEDTRREKVANYREWFDEHSARMSRLTDAVGEAVLNAFARREASRGFGMRHAAMWED